MFSTAAVLLLMYSMMKACHESRPRTNLSFQNLCPIANLNSPDRWLWGNIYGRVALFAFSFIVFMITPPDRPKGAFKLWSQARAKPAEFLLLLFFICHHSIHQKRSMFRSFIPTNRLIHLTASNCSQLKTTLTINYLTLHHYRWF